VEKLRVGVVDEHEIFRRGLVASLREDPLIDVTVEASAGPVSVDLDVAVVSSKAVSRTRLRCPLVVCTSDAFPAQPNPASRVMAVLPRGTVTPEQLVGAVRAAAAGLRVDAPVAGPEAGRLDHRRLSVLRLLATGAGTQEISASLRYSERTIKALIQEIERELGARNRVQAVAEGIRQGLI